MDAHSSMYSSGENPAVLDADQVFLLMKRDVPVSRSARLLWLVTHLGQEVTVPDWDQPTTTGDLELFSVVPAQPVPAYWRPDAAHQFVYRVTTRTRVYFLAHRYKLSVCLDLSPSQSVVDVQRGLLLLDQLSDAFGHLLRKLAEPLVIPGTLRVLRPRLYLTVIAHTPFFTTPAQQVLIKGIRLTRQNVDAVLDIIEKQLAVLEQKISHVTALAHEQIEAQQAANEQLIGALFDEDVAVKPPSIPMVSPDASFINMLRYAMLALALLPDISLGNILMVTDGVICMPDINILESLLQQLHFDGTSVSFLQIGSAYHPHCNFGYVAYRDILRFIAASTLGFYAENYYNPQVMLDPDCHQHLFLWTYHSHVVLERAFTKRTAVCPTEWTTTNGAFHGERTPALLKKKQAEDKLHVSLGVALSRRLREGFTLDSISLDNDRLEVVLSLPWQTHTHLIYTLVAQWPSVLSQLHFQVSIRAPYEALHDLVRKQLRSTYRQTLVDRFWAAIAQLTTGDTPTAQHLNLFTTSGVWYMLPESVRNGMPVFSVQSSSTVHFAVNDPTLPKFNALWQTVCQLENTHWRRWFHMHRLSIVLRHDQPLPAHLHLPNSSGRFAVVQCRQALAALTGTLAEFASFVLIDNQAYVKFLYRAEEKAPTWFCVIRLLSKAPCPVLSLAFVTGTPGQVRNQICADLRTRLQRLTVRAQQESPAKARGVCACILLVKPLEKILIRYERMPADLTTVVFPDGTQPTFDPLAYITQNHSRRQSSQSSTPRPSTAQPTTTSAPTTAALLTTLSRYLHHRRWVWGITYPGNPQLSHVAVARMLNTITRMRLKEGFSFAHCAAGIINMAIEVEMVDEEVVEVDDEPAARCVVQYVLFPPHSVLRRSETGSSDSEEECEADTGGGGGGVEELQMVTEVWVEPQAGGVRGGALDGLAYRRVADVIGEVDARCICALLTVEHLSLMCQQRRQLLPTTAYFSQPPTVDNQSDVDDRIHRRAFAFDLRNILPKCRQAQLLFSTFSDLDVTPEHSPNHLLLDQLFERLQQFNDHVLDLREADSHAFLQLCMERGAKRIQSSSTSLWRCFVRGLSERHVLLTFVPASVRDLLALHTTPRPDQLFLPIFIFDCSLSALIDNFVGEVEPHYRDIFEDHTQKGRPSSVPNEIPEFGKSEDKLSLQRACRTLIAAHAHCFISCAFKALHLGLPVQGVDVEAAVALCETQRTAVDITQYIKTVCGHVKYKRNDTILTVAKLFQSRVCHELRYFHSMIRDKFRRKIAEYFRPAPSATHTFYYAPMTRTDHAPTDSESENWSDLSETADDSPRTASMGQCVDGLLDDPSAPLFLKLHCTVNGAVSGPVQVLPTCLEGVLRNLSIHWDVLHVAELDVQLEMVCATLPIVTTTTSGGDEPETGTYSPRQRFSSESSSDLISSTENLDVQSTAASVPYQSAAITALEEEIKWQLRDEIVTALLDLEPVTADTLAEVTHHVADMSNNVLRNSGQLDLVPLNFVYGPSESLGRFLQEFRKLPVPDYKLVKETDYYFLSKDYPSVTTLDSTSRRSRKQFAKDDKKKILLEVQDLMLDILNEVESDANENEDSKIENAPGDVAVDDEDCDPNCDYDWLLELDKRRTILPNFWMVMRVSEEAVAVHFHCRFLELHKTQVNAYLAVHRSVISAIKSLCKHVNQFLLLQSLHDTRTCDGLLEPEEVTRDWSLSRLRSVDAIEPPPDGSTNVVNGGTVATGTSPAAPTTVLEASLKYMPGFFACAVVWQTHFALHPRLKTGNNVRPGLSRGIQALRTVLNKFSVLNRSNMFVYRDSAFNVFYLRLHENVASGGGRTHTAPGGGHRPEMIGSSLVQRSPSIASLPIGTPRTSGSLTAERLTSNDIRPRVRSFGEKESQEAAAATPTPPPDDTITLKVHGVTGAGRDVTSELVQVLQNRLDDAVLELLSVMLERNPMCKLTPEDVHFLQKPFRAPDTVLRFAVRMIAAPNQHLHHYLHQNLLQFLYTPKYTCAHAHAHFRDYSEPEHVRKDERNIFLYNQSAASGSRGIACIAFVFQTTTREVIVPSSSGVKLLAYCQQVVSSIRAEPGVCQPDELLVEFRIWQKGRVNIETLSTRLRSALAHATWDLITEQLLLPAPLCRPLPIDQPARPDEFHQALNSNASVTHQVMRVVKHAAHSLDGGSKRNKPLEKTLSEIDNTDDGTAFENGESGMLHEIYAEVIRPWMQVGVALNVSSVARHSVTLAMSHPIDTTLVELQRFIKSHCNEMGGRAFVEMRPGFLVPFDGGYYTQNVLVLERNMEQWRASCSNDANTLMEPKSSKTLQKFNPYYEQNHNIFVARQRLLVIAFDFQTITFHTYNWSKERNDKLVTYGNNLGLWLNARAGVYNSVVAQKLGLFHNQPITRKQLSAQNAYLPSVTEPELVARFPSFGSAHRYTKPDDSPTPLLAEIFRDVTLSLIGHRVIYSSDPVVRSVQELHQLRQAERRNADEQRKLHAMWQSRGVTTHIPTDSHRLQLLRAHSRVLHYCHTPFLFLPGWRLQAASTRDHLLQPVGVRDPPEPWHDALCTSFHTAYTQYLQTLGFIPIHLGGETSATGATYLQKSMLGGILLFELIFVEPFFIAKLYALECQRIRNRTSSAMGQFTLSFLDECDCIKVLMHVHSYAYDFHLRCIHAYVQEGEQTSGLCSGYHLTNFLDDFIKYYPKGPNYARNLLLADSLRVDQLATPSAQLYDYLLGHERQYAMRVFTLNGTQPEYVLAQAGSSPSFTYHDAHDREHTDDLDITLVVARLDDPDPNALRLQYYLLLTSRRETYPQPEVERTLGKFRTVTASPEELRAPQLHDLLSEHTPPEIRPEPVNYLGYYSSHEQLMAQIMGRCAEGARARIRSMVERGALHCRTHLLWSRLVCSGALTYAEFIELRNLTRLERLQEVEPQLKPLLQQPLAWFQQLARVIVAKYLDQHRYFVSPDGNLQHYVVLHPRYSGAFMLLSVDISTGCGELFAAYREPAHLEPEDISLEDRHSLVTDFVNCVCFHVWMGLLG